MNTLHPVSLAQASLLPSLVSNYVNHSPALSQLTKYPFSFSAFKNIITDKANDNTDRKTLVEVLKQQYADIPTTNAVSSNIESLLHENTFTITAAHQPCLFLGPLYNIYKIASIISLSNKLVAESPGHHFVPVFWLGSEDHDVEELSHTYINGKRIDWAHGNSGASGKWNTASMKTAVDELKVLSVATEITSLIEEGIKRYNTFGKFTQYFVNEIFKEHGLVVLDGDNKALKQSFSSFIKEEVLNQRAVEVLKPTIDFLEANYKAQAKPRDINFFYLGENYRERIVYNNTSQRFEINNTTLSFSKTEMEQEIENHPERFSPNVIYRPLYQEFTLPNLAFTGGAGELSYWLELKLLFEHYKVNYPLLCLRSSAFVITEAIQKKLDKLNLTVEDFRGDVELLINRFVKQSMNADLNLAAEKQKLEELFASVSAKAEAADVTLKQSAATEKQKALTALENLEAKMLKAEKRKQETSVNQIRAVHATLYPEGTLQERRENFIPFYSSQFISNSIRVCRSF